VSLESPNCSKTVVSCPAEEPECADANVRISTQMHMLNDSAEPKERRATMSRWNLVVADETDRTLRSYLARTGGKKGDLSWFVERAVRQAIFRETLDSVWERNKHLTAAEVQELADRAVAEARADRP